MNRIDIAEMHVHMSYPAITLVAKCDRVVIKERLDALLSSAEQSADLSKVRGNVNNILEHFFCPYGPKKIAILINKHIARVYSVPVDIEDYQEISHHFVLDPIIKSLNRKERYWVLVGQGDEARFYEGYTGELTEVVHTASGLPWHIGHPVCLYKNDLACLYSQIDRHIDRFFEQDPLPLLIVGSSKEQELFKTHSKYAQSVCAFASDLHQVPALAHTCYERLYRSTLTYADRGGSDVVSQNDVGYDQIMKHAWQGSIETLLVEKGLTQKGCSDKITGEVATENACTTYQQSVDIVDAIIEEVKAKRGTVFLLPDGALSKYGGMVAITRF